MIRSASSKKDQDTARALLEDYLRLPDGWPKHRVPASLPASMSDYLDGFPSPACQAPQGIVLVAGPDQVSALGLVVLTELDQDTAAASPSSRPQT
jgi:hypothetical protein